MWMRDKAKTHSGMVKTVFVYYNVSYDKSYHRRGE